MIYIKINRLSLIGIILLIIGLIIVFTDLITPIIRPFTYTFLMGSSKGKDILFFFLMGSMLLISPLFSTKSYLYKKINTFNFFKSWNKNDFLKMVIILVLVTYAMGIIIEIWLRLNFDVSLFTTFVALEPHPNSTSILHSHVFKGAISPIFSSLVSFNSNIYTGESLIQYLPAVVGIIFLSVPLVYLGGLFSLGDRRDSQKAILIFALATSIIGMIDGGLLSTPGLVGLAGILGISAIKVPFNLKNLFTPALIIALLVILRVFLGLFLSVPDYYEVTVLGVSDDIELAGYEVLSSRTVNDKTIFKLNSNYNELELLNNLTLNLKGKAEGFFISWNFYSFFK